MADAASAPGQPGHGKNTQAGITVVPGTEDRYTFFCGACDEAGVAYDNGHYGLDEAEGRLEMHKGYNTQRARDLARLDQLMGNQ